jgi:hypothetical protein
MESYFKKHPHVDDIVWAEFVPWFKVNKMGTTSATVAETYDLILSTLEDCSPTDDEKTNVLEFLLEKDYCIKIADHSLKVSEGDDTKSILDIEGMLNEYEVESARVSDMDKFSTVDLDTIFDEDIRTGYTWRLNELNKSCGKLREEDFVIITSRPDSGKTTMLCSEATHMAAQMPEGKCVYWGNNEEAIHKVISRAVQATLGCTVSEMRAMDPLTRNAEIEAALGGKFFDKFCFHDAKHMRTTDVERKLNNCDPGLIVLDQLWKIDGFPDAAGETDKLTKLFGWARWLAEQHKCPVLVVHQASSDAHGQAYIEMNQMYGSKTGAQGEADALIGIGRVLDDSVSNDTRFLNISKNKMTDVEEEYRNGKWQVEILPQHARFRGYV